MVRKLKAIKRGTNKKGSVKNPRRRRERSKGEEESNLGVLKEKRQNTNICMR